MVKHKIIMSVHTKQKKRTWQWMSKYIRLRDSVEYCREAGLPLDSGVGRCCTCGEIIQWKYGDAGHYFSRGSGGGSGAYFDERNVNLQCKPCNAFEQGNPELYREFMLQKYGQKVIDELEILHRGGRKYQYGEFEAIAEMYKRMFKELSNQNF